MPRPTCWLLFLSVAPLPLIHSRSHTFVPAPLQSLGDDQGGRRRTDVDSRSSPSPLLDLPTQKVLASPVMPADEASPVSASRRRRRTANVQGDVPPRLADMAIPSHSQVQPPQHVVLATTGNAGRVNNTEFPDSRDIAPDLDPRWGHFMALTAAVTAMVPDLDFGPEGTGNVGRWPMENPMYGSSNEMTLAGLLVELHLPNATLEQLHTSQGPLLAFLQQLRGELSKAAGVSGGRISVIGINGRYQRANTDGSVTALRKNGSIVPKRINEEVVVRLELSHAASNRPKPQEVFHLLREKLSTSSSSLMCGSLGPVLQNASLQVSLPAGNAEMNSEKQVPRLSAIVLPIGISAAFTGILIWLASW